MPEIKKLHDNLKRQVLLYQELKNYAQRKQQALVENNLQGIEAITVREEQLIMEAASLERERLVWAEQIAQRLGKAPEEIIL
ncbi:MAG: flagellar protein FlgN, partial [Desulfitobacterium sp.]|nr:flagellar protein FlgN [Desulfitobacterium sp.]